MRFKRLLERATANPVSITVLLNYAQAAGYYMSSCVRVKPELLSELVDLSAMRALDDMVLSTIHLVCQGYGSLHLAVCSKQSLYDASETWEQANGVDYDTDVRVAQDRASTLVFPTMAEMYLNRKFPCKSVLLQLISYLHTPEDVD